MGKMRHTFNYVFCPSLSLSSSVAVSVIFLGHWFSGRKMRLRIRRAHTTSSICRLSISYSFANATTNDARYSPLCSSALLECGVIVCGLGNVYLYNKATEKKNHTQNAVVGVSVRRTHIL